MWLVTLEMRLGLGALGVERGVEQRRFGLAVVDMAASRGHALDPTSLDFGARQIAVGDAMRLHESYSHLLDAE